MMLNNEPDLTQAAEYATHYESFARVFNWLILAFRSHPDNDEFIRKAIHLTGENLQVDRCYFFQVDALSESETRVSQLFEWSAPGITPQRNNPDLQGILMDTFPEALGDLKKGSVHAGLIRDYPNDAFREIMTEQQISSFLFAPVMVENALWGFVGFDDCEVERVWNNEYIQFIEALAEMISSKVEWNFLQGQLLARQRQLEIAIESSNDGFWFINLEKNQMFLSKQWKRMLGYEEHELDNSFQTFEELIHPQDRKAVLHVLDPYVNLSGGTVECEYRLRNKEGRYQWILTQAYVKRGESGKPERFLGTNIDIPARVNYKTHLEQKEEEYRNLVDSVSEVIFRIGNDGIFTFLNPAWERITGFSVSKTMGSESIQYIHPEQREMIMNKLFGPTESEESSLVNLEIRLLNSSGQAQWAELFANIKRSKRKLIEISGTIIDIHQRKTAEFALRESEERFRLMSENMSDLVSLHDRNGTYFYLSPSVKELLGYEPFELVGNSLYSLVPDEDSRILRQDIHEPLLAGILQKGIGQVRMKHRNGTMVWFETIMQPIRKEGRIESLMSVARDISSRKLAELEMKKALEKEKELNELKSRFISMASHEFRTPLASIKSSVELLEMYSEEVGQRLSRPFLKHFDKIIGQIDRLSGLMNDVLLLGRTEADKMPFEPEPTDIVAFCHDFLEQNYLNLEDGREIRIVNWGENRPVELDHSLLGHILSNGLSNALKYSRGKQSPELHIRFENDGVLVSIRDYGIGIPKEEQNQLFQSFFRAENTINIEGTGLGLVIMRQFVEMHNGSITIESDEGEGTTVNIHLLYRIAGTEKQKSP